MIQIKPFYKFDVLAVFNLKLSYNFSTKLDNLESIFITKQQFTFVKHLGLKVHHTYAT